MTDLERIIAEMREASLAQRQISQREFSCGLHEWADRLAALAGAAPDGSSVWPWLAPLGRLVAAAGMREYSAADQEAEVKAAHLELFNILRATHAPAKAREDAIRALLLADDSDGPEWNAAIRAALATFAEGAE